MKTQILFARRLTALAIAAASLIAAPLLVRGQGQAQQDKSVPLSQVERKNRAPVSKDILKVTLPKPVETTLPNGLTVMILEDHRLPQVTVQLQITGAGSLFEPAAMPGLASITAQMLTQGTTTRSSKQVAEQIDRQGASLNAFAPFGSSGTAISASGLSDNFEQWFAITADVLLHPAFSADELAKLKQRQKASLKAQRTQPGFLATERFNRAVYGAFPAAVASTNDASLDSMSSADLKRWHDERYAPQNAILAIAGDINASTLVPQLTKWIADWHKSDFAEPSAGATAPIAGKRIFLVNRPGSVQTTIAMGNIAIDRRDPDYPAMVVLNQIFGAGPQSRLFLNLRENKGYTYGVYSNFTALKYAGPWRAGGDVRTDVTDGAMTEFLNELNRIRSEKVSTTELDDARHSVVANFALSLETPAQLVNYSITRKLYSFSADYWDTYPAKIMAVTADDVQRVAQKYIDPQTMQIVAVGDAAKIKSVMEKYGTVEMYGLDGKPAAPAASSPGSK